MLDHRGGVRAGSARNGDAAAGPADHHRRAQALAGMSDTSAWKSSAGEALWDLGNALFIATALATIVNSARGSRRAGDHLCTKAALGLGIAVGPLVGGVAGLDLLAWPVLRGVGADGRSCPASSPRSCSCPSRRAPSKGNTLADPFRALRHRGHLGVAMTALLKSKAHEKGESNP